MSMMSMHLNCLIWWWFWSVLHRHRLYYLHRGLCYCLRLTQLTFFILFCTPLFRFFSFIYIIDFSVGLFKLTCKFVKWFINLHKNAMGWPDGSVTKSFVLVVCTEYYSPLSNYKNRYRDMIYRDVISFDKCFTPCTNQCTNTRAYIVNYICVNREMNTGSPQLQIILNRHRNHCGLFID